MSPAQVITANVCPDRHGEKGAVGSISDHRTMEGSKSPLRSSCPAIPPALPWSPLNHVPYFPSGPMLILPLHFTARGSCKSPVQCLSAAYTGSSAAGCAGHHREGLQHPSSIQGTGWEPPALTWLAGSQGRHTDIPGIPSHFPALTEQTCWQCP